MILLKKAVNKINVKGFWKPLYEVSRLPPWIFTKVRLLIQKKKKKKKAFFIYTADFFFKKLVFVKGKGYCVAENDI